MHSFWEYEQWFKGIDFAVIGSGIVGINCALALKSRHPEANVVILEKGYIPAGASSKNAGFACFGSPSEILSDLENSSEDHVVQLIERRVKGLERLKSICGESEIDFLQLGSHELFRENDHNLYEKCADQHDYLNQILTPIVGKNTFSLADENIKSFGFSGTQHLIKNQYEGQIDTGKMITKLLYLATKKGIRILNGIEVDNVSDDDQHAIIRLSNGYSFKAKSCFITNNGFAKALLPDLDVKPARAQVLITAPIKGLKLQGTFHMDEGYYYFRNVGNRILFGGGRNLNFEGETTTELSISGKIQTELIYRLKHIIAPYHQNIQIEHQWAGIMGVGKTKQPIVKKISSNIYCGIRMGGMGVAIGSLIGEELALLLD